MNIFIADDHPLIVDGYKMILSFSDLIKDNVNFIEAHSCEQAFFKIKDAEVNHNEFDLAILDYSMPAYLEQNIFNGVDVCALLQKAMPSCKIIILTGIIESLPLFEMVQKHRPNAVATKCEISGDILLHIIEVVVGGGQYRSSFVTEQIEEVWATNTFANEQNRIILYNLSNGLKVKEIAEELSVSEISIKKRVCKIRKSLNISQDCSILKEAKIRGYI